ncbi:LysR family transcriptional regulator [Nonomuraea rhodomycinica]|uniref:LysR family transcriptional regulator n=1 Tax=Nonomuraea rhodomycinica TaxID=1712872 RepID=A0A7Y6MA73_9ACTN|nr:LysR substrate-binding domain-containing protein [Nonomuraea rhodomycinica]NUW39530.1 LysR family transcriptional regulator [Nonomuraea rhodomycinica]
MELRQLHYLLAIVEEGSFTRAAARVHVAQPAISQQIAQLERELGERLFDRSGRRIRLTPAGEAFLPHARAAVDAAASGRDAVTALHGVLAGQLMVGTVSSPPSSLLDHLACFRRRHPGVRLTLRTGAPEELTAQVVAGALDAAVIGVLGTRLPAGPAGQRLPAGLATRDVAEEPLVIVVAPGHPLAAQASMSLSDLRGEPMVTLTWGTGLRAALEAACAEEGFLPEVRAESDELTVLVDLVRHGFGVALMPRSAAERAHPHVVAVPLRPPAPSRRLALVWRRDRLSPQGRAFVDLAGHD